MDISSISHCHTLLGVRVSMRNQSTIQDEGEGNVIVCAQLDSPSGGIERGVTVHLASTQHGSTGLQNNRSYDRERAD